MGVVSVTLLGSFCVTVDGQPVTGLHSDKVRALLAFLLAERGRLHRRETLAGLLWPDYPEARARQSLSQALYSLRGSLRSAAGDEPSWLSLHRDGIALHPPAAWEIDVLRFEDVIEACRAHEHADPYTCPSCGARLAQAAALYRDEFLAGLALRDSAAFDEWLTVARERYRRLTVDVLQALAARGERGGDSDAALGYARRWVELEPLDERAHRQVMRLLALSGQHAAALAQYEACRRILGDALGAEPDSLTALLGAQIREGRFICAPGDTTFDRAEPPAFLAGDERHRTALFVSREAEMERLQSHLERALAGEAGFVFVSGEAGSGKTALLQAFGLRAQAEHAGLVLATGRCNAHTGIGDPYLAWREILAQLAGDVQGGWEGGAMRRDEAARLWALMPVTCRALVEVGRDLPGTLLDGEALLARAQWAAVPEAPWVDALRGLIAQRRFQTAPDLRQVALFQQLTAVLQRLAGHQPLLLVLEDLHWADAGTVSLLFHLGTHLTGERVLIVGTLRPAELASGGEGDLTAQRHPLEPVLHELQRRHGEIVLDLDGADGRGFVSALLDADSNALDDAFREALYRQTGGNALFTTELLQAMRERGALRRDGAGRWRLEETVRWGDLPPRVEGVIAERVGRLPAGLQEALRVASVEGETFTAEVVARVLGTEPRALVRELSGAAGSRHHLIAVAGLSRAQGRPLSIYRFRHILIQQSLYDSVDPAARVYLHGEVGDALVALHGGDDDTTPVERRHEHTVAGQLARHYEEAGDVKRAVSWLRRAGDRAEHLGALAEAALHHSRGLALTDRLPTGWERDAARLPLLQGLATANGLRLGTIAPELVRIVEEALAIGERMDHAVACVRALSTLASIHVERAEYGKAQDAAKTMLAWAHRGEDDGLIAWALSTAAEIDHYLGHFEQALHRLEPALAQWDAGDRAGLHGTLVYIPHNTVRLLTRASLALVPLGHCDQALGRLHEALAEARAENLELGLYLISAVEMLVYLQLSAYGQSLPWALECSQRAARGGIASYNPWCLACEGVARAHLGGGERSVALVREALSTTEAMGLRNLVPGLLQFLADSCLAGGQVQEALAAAERGIALCIEVGPGWPLALLHLLRGQALVSLDRPDPAGAEAAFLEALAVARRQEARLYELRAAVALGRLWLSQGRTEEALALVQPVYNWFTEGFDLPDLVEARELLAELGGGQ